MSWHAFDVRKSISGSKKFGLARRWLHKHRSIFCHFQSFLPLVVYSFEHNFVWEPDGQFVSQQVLPRPWCSHYFPACTYYISAKYTSWHGTAWVRLNTRRVKQYSNMASLMTAWCTLLILCMNENAHSGQGCLYIHALKLMHATCWTWTSCLAPGHEHEHG